MSNREIKIRVWNIAKKEMSPGMPLPMLAGWLFAAYQTKSLDDMIYLEFTGARDKNGKPIYEGDILRDQFKNEVVTWSKRVSTNYGHGDSTTTINYGFSFGNWGNTEDGVVSELVVIGNEFENPELLINK